MIDYWRQLDIVTPAQLDFPIQLIGAGGIGSPTAVLLAKMGVKRLQVRDFDIITSHNLPSTIYRLQDIKKPKVQALAEIIKSFTGIDIDPSITPFTNQELNGVVISGVDSMKARITIWNKVKFNINIPLYIDARMAAEVFVIHAINPTNPDQVEWYESTLPKNAAELKRIDETTESCTNRSVIYNTFGIASIIVNIVKKFAVGQVFPKEFIFDFTNFTIYTK